MEIKFKKVHTMKDLIVSTIMVAAGAACFLLGEGWGGLGIVIIMCGAMMLPFYHHGYRLEGQKDLFRLKELSMSRENKDEILAFLDGTTEDIDLHPWAKGGAAGIICFG